MSSSRSFKKRREAAGGDGGSGGKGKGKGLLSTRTRIIIGIVVAMLAAIILSASWLSRFYTDYLWFSEVGQTGVFWKVITTKIWVFFLFGGAFFLIFYFNIHLARRLTPKYELAGDPNPLEQGLSDFREGAGRWLGRGLLALSVFISLLVGWAAGHQWEKVLKFFTYTGFGKTDPIFSKDVGFYLFKLPLLEYVFGWLTAVLVGTLAVTAAVHFLYGAINFSRNNRRFAGHAKAHLSVLAGLALLVQAYRFRLQMFTTLHHTSGNFTGAHYSDVHALIPALYILIFVSLVCAALFIANIWFKGWKLPAAGLATIVLVSLLAGSLYPFIIQKYVVKPKELSREYEYLGHNIEFTQDAYGIQNDGESPDVDWRQFPVDQDLDYDDILANETIVRNIRLWGPLEMLGVLNQRQVLRQIYRFTDIDVDRYTMEDGLYNQMLVSARELSYDQLPESARSWQNEHLSYTHGFGACMAPSNDFTPEGNPLLVVRDIPPVSDPGLGVEIERPELYFNETNQGYVVVRTGAPEINYSAGSTTVNVEPYYEGSGGVQISNLLRRLAFSIRFADINLLLSGYVNSDSRLMFRRTLSDRIKTVAPFLTLDADPYLVVDDAGGLVWIQDAYTTSDLYPYSEYNNGKNYIRNSVKITVNAYDGKTTFYMVDSVDPVVRTYAKIFPGLFTPFEEMPEDIQRHLRYPESLFNMQMDMFKAYHMDEVEAFYHKEDMWDLPTQTYGIENKSVVLSAFYLILKLPGEEREELVLMQPFNPRGKDNMVDWMAARCDVPNYGHLINYSFPANKLVLGVQQFESLVNQQTSISEQITLWNQAGSRVIRGNTLVIPIETSLLYVEPLYLQATDPPIPQIKRVIVSDGSRVLMANDLDEALRELFGGGGEPAEPAEPGQEATTAQLAARANQLFEEAQAAQRAGDWAAYGEKTRQLGVVLEQLARLNPD